MSTAPQIDTGKPGQSRRSFVLGVAAAATAPHALVRAPGLTPDRRLLRIRALTAGVSLTNLRDARPVDAALDALVRTKRRFEEAGYEVQTLRVATPPVLGAASAQERQSALGAIRELDDVAARRGTLLSIGSVLTLDQHDPGLAAWARELVQTTRVTSFSVTVAAEHRQSRLAARAAAEVMVALSRAAPQDAANFRFAAAANVPAGTPFFPVAYHDGPDALAVGLESPRLIREAVVGGSGIDGAEQKLREALDGALAPVATLAAACARDERQKYLGIDPSPAPGMDSSIGQAIETLTGRPFGDPSTLDACAAITGALKQLRVLTCGYAGLMLPVLEDPVLAHRAAEGRFGVRDLLLFSSVCGTGLDVVPLPGDTSAEVLARMIADVAALAVRLRKPLSARLFPVPGKHAGDEVTFDDPLLTKSVVLRAE